MRYLMFLLGLMFANVAQAVDCDVVPTCEELGYSKADDPYCADNGYMYCPLDHSYKKCVNMDCAKMGFTEDDKTSWCGKLAKCKGNPKMTLCQNLCEIGDVFYADGTCGYVEDYDSSNKNKIPVGVVYWVTDSGRHGKVINLHDLTFDEKYLFDPKNPFGQKYAFSFIKSPGVDFPSQPYSNFTQLLEALKNNEHLAYAGKESTQTLWESSGALMVKDFYPPHTDPSNPITGQGKWFLPSVGEFLMLQNPDTSKLVLQYNNGVAGIMLNTEPKILRQVEETLKALQNKNVQVSLPTKATNYYWTSTYSWHQHLCAFAISKHIGHDSMVAIKPIRVMLDF